MDLTMNVRGKNTIFHTPEIPKNYSIKQRIWLLIRYWNIKLTLESITYIMLQFISHNLELSFPSFPINEEKGVLHHLLDDPTLLKKLVCCESNQNLHFAKLISLFTFLLKKSMFTFNLDKDSKEVSRSNLSPTWILFQPHKSSKDTKQRKYGWFF